MFKKGLHEAHQLKNMLIDQNIPPEDILIESNSRNTHENALETVNLLKKKKLMGKSFLFITSALHMRRDMGCFEKEGIKCTSFSTYHYHIASGGSFSANFILPNPDAFLMWQRIIKEWAGTLMYRFTGYL
ncbi:MAG: YdcF family protein [Crocinitomicaceae bacterium]